jgi:hypothetical protein
MAKFKKGQSGNPKGRPKAARGLRAALLARHGDDGEVLVARAFPVDNSRPGYRYIRTTVHDNRHALGDEYIADLEAAVHSTMPQRLG